MDADFSALVIERDETGRQEIALRQMAESALPGGDVTVRVEYSTLNYKDALAITGQAPVIRQFPMIPGIDFAGTVTRCDDPALSPGDRVILNGWGLGEKHWGGLAGMARVPAAWLVPLPETLSSRQAMAIGTAGYTAMLSVMALERNGIQPETGPVIVSGASGGVGSLAVMLLSRLGYRVEAMTGRPAHTAWLRSLGATAILDRALFTSPCKPLAREQWAGAIDTAGGQILANICAGMAARGVVTACGLAAGMEFPATVAPFILRGISLIGIDSVYCPRALRLEAWKRLSDLVDQGLLESLVQEIGLSDAPAAARDLLEGRCRGRLVVAIGG
ncbi:acrylyl-CoA reductase (NADPH) [Asaia krungthepensis]|uniref:Alcohol dehydrogenase n=1 Tax=Asaia krungthepensis NRIC 0535 TaxID=1307925 RepID=A0ABQ0Q3H6_9PROT|nr:MDR family oxidoreductase [Asaia krungthepensis]GBQ89459.1 alcohol dehydrogenase [Asaia krungthepensis NRIC 0535]